MADNKCQQPHSTLMFTHTHRNTHTPTCRSRSSSILFWLSSSAISCNFSFRARLSCSTLKYSWGTNAHAHTHTRTNFSMSRKNFVCTGLHSLLGVLVHFSLEPVGYHSCPGLSRSQLQLTVCPQVCFSGIRDLFLWEESETYRSIVSLWVSQKTLTAETHETLLKAWQRVHHTVQLKIWLCPKNKTNQQFNIFKLSQGGKKQWRTPPNAWESKNSLGSTVAVCVIWMSVLIVILRNRKVHTVSNTVATSL